MRSRHSDRDSRLALSGRPHHPLPIPSSDTPALGVVTLTQSAWRSRSPASWAARVSR